MIQFFFELIELRYARMQYSYQRLTLNHSGFHLQASFSSRFPLFSSLVIPPPPPSNVKKLLEDLDRMLRVLDPMSDSALILVDFVIVAALVGLVAEEVDGRVLDAGNVLLQCKVLQAVCLVPAGGKDVKGDLSADRISIDED